MENALPRCAAEADQCAASKGPGKIDPPVPLAARDALACNGVRRNPLRMGPKPSAKSTRGDVRNTQQISNLLRREGTQTPSLWRAHTATFSPSRRFRSARGPAGFRLHL